jgi:hypothetical protein
MRSPSRRDALDVRGARLSRVAGEGEEDVVEGGTMRAELVDPHPCGVEVANEGGQ